MPTPVPPPHTPAELTTAARLDPETDDVYPCQISVYCDACGHTETHDHVVHEDMWPSDRLELARAHLRKHGWSCDDDHDLCPDCR